MLELADFVRDEDIPYRETDRDWSWLEGADLRDDLIFKAALDDAEDVTALLLTACGLEYGKIISVKAAEASAEGISIYGHCVNCKVANAYKELTQEVLNDGFEFVAMARALVNEPGFVNRMKEDEHARCDCGHSNYCIARMYSLDMACHKHIQNLPECLIREIKRLEYK